MAAIVSLAGARLNAAPRPAAAALLPPLHRCHRRRFVPLASGAASVPGDSGSSSSSNGASVPDPAISGNGATASPAAAWEQQQEQPAGGLFGWLRSQREKSGELRKRLAALGLAAVLAYGESAAVVALGLLIAACQNSAFS